MDERCLRTPDGRQGEGDYLTQPIWQEEVVLALILREPPQLPPNRPTTTVTCYETDDPNPITERIDNPYLRPEIIYPVASG